MLLYPIPIENKTLRININAIDHPRRRRNRGAIIVVRPSWLATVGLASGESAPNPHSLKHGRGCLDNAGRAVQQLMNYIGRHAVLNGLNILFVKPQSLGLYGVSS